MCESADNKTSFSAVITAGRCFTGTLTVLLHQEEPNTIDRPVGSKACYTSRVKQTYTFLHLLFNDLFGLVKYLIWFICPAEHSEWFQKSTERFHLSCHGECICPLVYKPKPSSGTSNVSWCWEVANDI